MKIDNSILGPSAVTGNESKQQQSGEDQVSFADQLAQVIQKALVEVTSRDKLDDEKPEDLQEELLKNDKGMVAAINNRVAMNSVDAPGAALPARESVNALEDLLGILEEYEARLADPSTSLKQLGSLVSNMQQKAQALESSLAYMDSSITPLADQIIGQAQVEAIKFQRGDYIE